MRATKAKQIRRAVKEITADKPHLFKRINRATKKGYSNSENGEAFLLGLKFAVEEAKENRRKGLTK